MPAACTHAHYHLLPACCLPDAATSATHPREPSLPLLMSIPSTIASLSLCISWPTAAIAAIRCHHATMLLSPPRVVCKLRHRPLRRLEQASSARTPQLDRLDSVFKLRSPENAVAVPSPQVYPEHADRIIVIPVSPCTVPL